MQSCGMTKGVDEKIDEGVLQWFCRVERMEKDRIASLCRKCTGSRSVGRPQKRWIDTVKDYLKKIGLGVRQARRMVHHGRSVWGEFMRENKWGVARGMNHRP